MGVPSFFFLPLFGSYFNASEPMVRVELSNSERFQGPVETLTSVPSTLGELRKMGCIMHGPFHSARSAGGKNDATFVFFGEGVGLLERGPAEKRSFHLHLRFFIVSSWSHALCGISKTYCI